MFYARFEKYWCDYRYEFENKAFTDIRDILEYVYKIHENSCYPAFSRFSCGKSKFIENAGYLEASCSIMEQCGYRGSVWLEEIKYSDTNGNTAVVFSKHPSYISPKTAAIFEEFAKEVKNREDKKFGEW